MAISINRFYADRLGATLKNPQWSWGAFDSAGRLFLKVWEDEIATFDAAEWAWVDMKNPPVASHGRPERRQHLEAVRNGAEYFGIVCIKKPKAADELVNSIAGFHETPLLRLGKLIEKEGRTYARIEERVPLDEILRHAPAREAANDVVTIIHQPNTKPTTVTAQVENRLGQGKFRDDVLDLWDDRCAISGSSTVEAIRASHIKPWKDSNDQERLDSYNGLPLVATLDALFDAGLISFEASGKMLVSRQLNDAERAIFGLVGKSLSKKPTSETAQYLHYHRSHRFQK